MSITTEHQQLAVSCSSEAERGSISAATASHKNKKSCSGAKRIFDRSGPEDEEGRTSVVPVSIHRGPPRPRSSSCKIDRDGRAVSSTTSTTRCSTTARFPLLLSDFIDTTSWVVSLPAGVWHIIALFSDVRTVGCLSATCSELWTLIHGFDNRNSQLLWRPLLERLLAPPDIKHDTGTIGCVHQADTGTTAHQAGVVPRCSSVSSSFVQERDRQRCLLRAVAGGTAAVSYRDQVVGLYSIGFFAQEVLLNLDRVALSELARLLWGLTASSRGSCIEDHSDSLLTRVAVLQAAIRLRNEPAHKINCWRWSGAVWPCSQSLQWLWDVALSGTGQDEESEDAEEDGEAESEGADCAQKNDQQNAVECWRQYVRKFVLIEGRCSRSKSASQAVGITSSSSSGRTTQTHGIIPSSSKQGVKNLSAVALELLLAGGVVRRDALWPGMHRSPVEAPIVSTGQLTAAIEDCWLRRQDLTPMLAHLLFVKALSLAREGGVWKLSCGVDRTIGVYSNAVSGFLLRWGGSSRFGFDLRALRGELERCDDWLFLKGAETPAFQFSVRKNWGNACFEGDAVESGMFVPFSLWELPSGGLWERLLCQEVGGGRRGSAGSWRREQDQEVGGSCCHELVEEVPETNICSNDSTTEFVGIFGERDEGRGRRFGLVFLSRSEF